MHPTVKTPVMAALVSLRTSRRNRTCHRCARPIASGEHFQRVSVRPRAAGQPWRRLVECVECGEVTR